MSLTATGGRGQRARALSRDLTDYAVLWQPAIDLSVLIGKTRAWTNCLMRFSVPSESWLFSETQKSGQSRAQQKIILLDQGHRVPLLSMPGEVGLLTNHRHAYPSLPPCLGIYLTLGASEDTGDVILT